MDCTSLPAQVNVIDTSSQVLTDEILFPFAFDEACARQVGAGQMPPTVHIWRHRKAFVLGARDRKLPHVLEAVQWLKSEGYSVTVRNSGGAAVPLDPGVENLSLILPIPQGHLDVQSHFQLMAGLIRESLKRCSFAIETGEVVGSYCPGEFDVGIGGRKFCGIAQRRQTRAVAVQAFVLAEGSGEERARLVKRFYDIASGGSPAADYPRVQPERMASLSELIGRSSVQSYAGWVKEFLSSCCKIEECHSYERFSPAELDQTMEHYRTRYQLNK